MKFCMEEAGRRSECFLQDAKRQRNDAAKDTSTKSRRTCVADQKGLEFQYKKRKIRIFEPL